MKATLVVLTPAPGRRGSRCRMSATTARFQPTLYHWFPSKKHSSIPSRSTSRTSMTPVSPMPSLDSTGGPSRRHPPLHREIPALLLAATDRERRAGARRFADEPGHAHHARAPTLPHFRGPDGFIVANVVTRIALSHALIPDDDSNLFYAELRHAAGLDHKHRAKPRHRR